MFSGNGKYIVVLVVLFALALGLQLAAPKPISWVATYRESDDQPFGSEVLFDQLEVLFPGKAIESVERPIYNVLKENEGNNFNYIFLNNYFQPDKLDRRELLAAVERGANVFIGANGLEAMLADTLGVTITSRFAYYMDDDSIPDSFDTYLYNTNMLNFTNEQLMADVPYLYKKGLSDYVISDFDSARTTVLAEDAEGFAHFVEVRHGNGNFYINTLPRTLTNYNLVHYRNHEYAFRALSYLPIAPVFWDEYYKQGGSMQTPTTPLRFMLQNISLKYAWFMALVSIFVFMIFNAKRRQRMIPVIKPLENTTLKFVDVVGRLYYQKGNHKHIAQKKVDFFLSHIRDHYQVPTQLFDAEFFRRLSVRAGIDRDTIEALFHYIDRMQSSPEVSQDQLIELNKQIEKFKEQSER